MKKFRIIIEGDVVDFDAKPVLADVMRVLDNALPYMFDNYSAEVHEGADDLGVWTELEVKRS